MAKKTKVTRNKTGRKGYWRDGFAPGEVIQRVRPTESDDYLGNPHRGTATFQRFNGDPLYPGERWNDKVGPTEFPERRSLKNKNYPQTTLSYCRWIWSVIEPQKGKFRWDILENSLKTALKRGQTLQIRMQPYIGDSTPAWYWKEGGKAARGSRCEPDANDPLYFKYWGRLIREMGKKFDGHPVLESVDISIAGSCGEGGGNASRKTIEKFIDLHLRSFKKTQLVVNFDGYQMEYGIKKGLGWRADCYGDVRTEGRGQVPENKNWNHMYDCYPMHLAKANALDQWKTAPVTLETCWTVGHWYNEGWDIDWIIDQGYKYHLSVFMPKSCAIPHKWADKIDEFDRKIGYRFVLRQMTLPLEAKPGDKFTVSAWIDNVGCAPIYRPYRMALRFRQGKSQHVAPLKQDLRKWLPDHNAFRERVTMPRGLRKGEVRVDAGIVNKKGAAVVKFAAEERGPDGWLPLTSMDVV